TNSIAGVGQFGDLGTQTDQLSGIGTAPATTAANVTTFGNYWSLDATQGVGSNLVDDWMTSASTSAIIGQASGNSLDGISNEQSSSSALDLQQSHHQEQLLSKQLNRSMSSTATFGAQF